MTVTAVRKDIEALTLDLTAEFDATPERIWQLWADPRLLERWWGPPTYPATFFDHDLTPGGRMNYFMTGPGRRQGRGVVADPRDRSAAQPLVPRRVLRQDGTPDPDFPEVTVHVAIEDIGAGRTRMSILSRFPTPAAMEQLAALGMVEGLTEAVGQIDAILAEQAVDQASR